MLAISDLHIADELRLSSIYTPRLPVAMFLFGLGIGPLYLEPLSELRGRFIVYIISYSIFTLFNLGCSFAPNMSFLATLRFSASLASSAGPCLGGSSIGDMFTRKNQDRAQAIYTFGTTIGPLLGGVIGGI
ncbi:hypothetical protein MMC19_000671 [Ptychographa xylographoides]|nr:hypothetical protein [Ptychographa xylographoides]